MVGVCRLVWFSLVDGCESPACSACVGEDRAADWLNLVGSKQLSRARLISKVYENCEPDPRLCAGTTAQVEGGVGANGWLPSLRYLRC
jgi:hypothetical protein